MSEDRKRTSISEIIELFKAMVRPYLICSVWTIWLILIVTHDEIPVLLAGIASAITLEYGLERAIKRLKGNGK